MVLAFGLVSLLSYGQKSTVENIYFREGVASFPTVGKGTITLNDGTKIKGEFKKGMLVKMNKWQWHDQSGKVHQIKAKNVQRVEFIEDAQVAAAREGLNIEINIKVGSNPTFVPKALDFPVQQFSDFDSEKHYEPIILERVGNKLMALVNNGFDAKYKIYVPIGVNPIEYGTGFSFYDLLFGGGECGKYYKSLRVVNTKTGELTKLRKPALVPFWLGAFRNKTFTNLFGESEDFMNHYPVSMKRKYRYMPEFIWVYNQIAE